MRTWEGRCHDINIKAFTWRFVLDESKLRNFQYSLEHCNGRCPRDVFIHIPLLIWLIASSDKPLYLYREKSIHIGVGFDVARSVETSNAESPYADVSI